MESVLNLTENSIKNHQQNINYYEIYNASEGFFGIQDRSGSDEMLLMLDYGIFYEFIPMDKFDRNNLQAIPLEEVELGKIMQWLFLPMVDFGVI